MPKPKLVCDDIRFGPPCYITSGRKHMPLKHIEFRIKKLKYIKTI